MTPEFIPAKMPVMKHSDQLLALASAYCAATGMSVSRLGEEAVRHHKFFKRISAGQPFLSSKAEEALTWFAANWPNDLPWPEDVERPVSMPATLAARNP